MEHLCEQCGTAVEDGRPFCPGCSAPQIRVPVRPPTAPVTEPLLPGTPDDLQPPAEPMMPERRSFEAKIREGSQPRLRLAWRHAWAASAAAGLVAAVGASVGIVPLTLLCMFAAGGLAVTFYQRLMNNHGATYAMGAKLGGLAGLLGSGAIALLGLLELASPANRVAVHKLLDEQMRAVVAANADPAAHQTLDQLRVYFADDHGLIIMYLLGTVFGGLFFAACSALGGMVGAALFGRKGDPEE